jgi:hypothetical protein
MLAVSGAAGPSVVRLRVQGLNASGVAAEIQRVLTNFADSLDQGAMVTVKVHKTTCSRLPVGQSGDDSAGAH